MAMNESILEFYRNEVLAVEIFQEASIVFDASNFTKTI